MLEKEINLNFHLEIHYTQKGIQEVSLQPSWKKGLQCTFVSHYDDSHLENIVIDWLDTYLQKKNPSIQLPFDWTHVTPFTQEVLQIVAKIPFGSLSTYGEISHLLDRPQSARAVGGACGRNPFVFFIPCHRVLDAQLELRGYSSGGVLVKKNILMFEGSMT